MRISDWSSDVCSSDLLKNGQPYETWLWALAVVAPLSGVLHWLESWIAHDMAFRLLAEMRIDAFRKLDALAPAYLVRRRTGDLMTLATHDIEQIGRAHV